MSSPCSERAIESVESRSGRAGAGSPRSVGPRTVVIQAEQRDDARDGKEIASALDISERTVETQLIHLFEKLGATSRTEAVKVATRRGLVRLD